MPNKSAYRATIQVSIPEPPMVSYLFNIIWGFPFLAIFSPFIPYKKIEPTYLILIFHTIVSSHIFGQGNFECILSYFFCDFSIISNVLFYMKNKIRAYAYRTTGYKDYVLASIKSLVW